MYSVPIIPSDLRHEEAIIQAANALDCLQKTIHDIFDRIDSRIEKNNTKIDELKTRINVASKKIDSLAGINKAIKIFSPSKFPASHVFRNIPVTFDNRYPRTFLSNEDYKVVNGLDSINHRKFEDKLVSYHVRDVKSSEYSKLSQKIDCKQGLGCVPSYINTVNSLLLFNTNVNIYDKIEIGMDGTFKSDGMKSKLNYNQTDSNGKKIEPPPISLSHRQIGERKFNEGFFYTPKLNDAPEIDVPADLPDLPGIADDINFDFTENERIAPSLYITNIADLPEPTDVQDNVLPNENEVEIVENAVMKNSTISSPPPPPPPMMLEKNPFTPNSSEIEIQSTTSIVPPPPPPPPELLQTSKPKDTSMLDKTTSHPQTQETPIPKVTDARMNLMEAIRKAGGAQGGKLRAAAEVGKSSPETTAVEKKPSGNLMADLHSKLLMRRKGISGTKESEGNNTKNVDKSNVMDRIRDMIPPPPKSIVHSSTTDASDDEDWNE